MVKRLCIAGGGGRGGLWCLRCAGPNRPARGGVKENTLEELVPAVKILGTWILFILSTPK